MKRNNCWSFIKWLFSIKLPIVLKLLFFSTASYSTTIYQASLDTLFQMEIAVGDADGLNVREVSYPSYTLHSPFVSGFVKEKQWVISSKSNDVLYLLFPLEDGFEWKELSKQGYFPKVKIGHNTVKRFYPFQGGWEKRSSFPHKLMLNDAYYFNYKHGNHPKLNESKQFLISLPIFYQENIQNLVIKVTGSIDNPSNVELEKNPANVQLVKYENGRPYQNGFYFISNGGEEIVFLERHHLDTLELQHIPAHFFPNLHNFGFGDNCQPNRVCPEFGGDKIVKISESNFGWNRGLTIGFKPEQKASQDWQENIVLPSNQNLEWPYLHGAKIKKLNVVIKWEENRFFTPFFIKKNLDFRYFNNFKEWLLETLRSNLEIFLILFINLSIFILSKIFNKLRLNWLIVVMCPILLSFLDYFLVYCIFVYLILPLKYVCFWLAVSLSIIGLSFYRWWIFKLFGKNFILRSINIHSINFLTALIFICVGLSLYRLFYLAFPFSV